MTVTTVPRITGVPEEPLDFDAFFAALEAALAGPVGVMVSDEELNPTTTPVSVLFEGGLFELEIAYEDLGSADGTLIYVTFGATSDADAATRLGTVGSRDTVLIGRERRYWSFSRENPCRRVDIKSDTAAETGDTVVLFTGTCVE